MLFPLRCLCRPCENMRQPFALFLQEGRISRLEFEPYLKKKYVQFFVGFLNRILYAPERPEPNRGTVQLAESRKNGTS